MQVTNTSFPASAETIEHRVFRRIQAIADANVNQIDQRKKSHHVKIVRF